MKLEVIVIILLMVGSFFLFYSLTDDSDSYESKIVEVIDGDTVVLEDGQRLRLKGINTPEKNKFFYEEAKEFLEGFLNESVKIVSFGGDRYGRTLGYIIFRERNINEEILGSGLGHLYYYDEDKYFDGLEDAEEKAREKGLGIWKKSENYGCIEVVEFVYLDISEEDSEKLVLENVCDFDLEVLIKDDATHSYEETISKDEFVLETKDIWNDDKDSIYIWDGEGLVYFERYWL